MPPTSPLFTTLGYVAAALLGVLAGMVVNLLAERIAGDEDPPWRSKTCQTCRAPLPARRLAPLVGNWLLGQRCPACGARLTWRRPAIEAALALVFPLLLLHLSTPSHADSPLRLAPLLVFAIEALAISVLALIFVIDLEHHLVLDVVVYPTAAAAILTAVLLDRKSLAAMVFGVVVCGGLFLLLYGAGLLFYRTEALGFGDVKLAVLLGILVGWPGIVGAITLCALFGFASTVVLLGLGRVSKQTYVAFGTFMSAGAVAALLLTAPYW